MLSEWHLMRGLLRSKTGCWLGDWLGESCVGCCERNWKQVSHEVKVEAKVLTGIESDEKQRLN